MAPSEWTNLVSGLVDALIGALGAYVGTWRLQNRETKRAARDAVRAVYHELILDRSVLAASVRQREFSPHPLVTEAYRTGLARIAGWLGPGEMYRLNEAYASIVMVDAQFHANEQLREPDLLKFNHYVEQLEHLAGLLGQRVFTPRELRDVLEV